MHALPHKSAADAAAIADAASRSPRLFHNEQAVDTLSLAWEFSARYGTPWPAAKGYAFREARTTRSRCFPERRYDIMGQARKHDPRTNPGPQRHGFDATFTVCDATTDPADAVAVRLDVREWWQHLSPRKRLIAERLYEGRDHGEIAQEIGVHRNRIGQIIRQIRASWEHFSGVRST